MTYEPRWDGYLWKGKPTSCYTKEELVEMLSIQSRQVDCQMQEIHDLRLEIINLKYQAPPLSPLHALFRWVFRLDRK